MRRLCLHIGADKCGSNSLQDYLSQAPRMMQRDGRPLRYVLFNQRESSALFRYRNGPADHPWAMRAVHRYRS